MPPWVLEKSLHEEMKNWEDAFEEVSEKDLPMNANVITSHVVYKVNSDENGKRKMKARLIPHGNGDRSHFAVRKDSATVQFDIIRLMLSLSAIMGLRLGHIDVEGACLQSGPITRDIYVRPPREPGLPRWTLWHLLKLPYGIVEAGRQWMLAVEKWLMSFKMGFQRVLGVYQLFVLRNPDRTVRMLCAKVTDDFLLEGSTPVMEAFDCSIRRAFVIGKTVIDGDIQFNGAHIIQTADGSVTLSMKDYLMSRPHDIPPDRSRRKQQEKPVNAQERFQYCQLAGMLNFLGQSVLPQACFVASSMQQKIGNLRAKHLCDANGMVRVLLQLQPEILYRAPSSEISLALVASFSDASFNISRSQCYEQNGFVTGVNFVEESSSDCYVYHVIDWSSPKQRRVCHSSFGAEILACADADGRGFVLRESINSILGSGCTKLRHHLYVDSRGLFDTVTTLHEGKDYRLRQTVQRIRDSFESGDLDVLCWIPGTKNVADALTKRGIGLYADLNKACTTGKLPAFSEILQLDGLSWT